MDFKTRAVTVKDWDMLVEWWDWWPGWTAPPQDFLPNHGTGGFIVEKNNQPIVAGFVYFTNSKVAWVEWIISSPNYKEDDRQDAIEYLINELEQFIEIRVEYGRKTILRINKKFIIWEQQLQHLSVWVHQL